MNDNNELPVEVVSGLKNHDILLKAMKGYLNTGVSGSTTDSTKQDLKGVNLLNYVISDPLVRSCFEITVGSIFKNGYSIQGVGSKRDNYIKSLRFDRFLRKYAWQLLIYQTSFTELVKDGTDKVIKLQVYDSPEFEIVHDDKGDIKKFLQVPASSAKTVPPKIIEFEKDEIFYSAYNEMTSSVWGHATLITLKEVIDSKHLVEGFIAWMFSSNQFRTVIKIPDDFNDKNLKQYLQLLIDSMNDPKKFLVITGDTAEHKPLREISGFNELLLLLDYYRSQILALLQLPPLQVGILSSSNRSNAEYQVRYSFYTRIQNLQNLIRDEIENELFPAIGLEGAEIIFNPLDDKTHNDYLDMATKLINMGADHKKVNEWLSVKIPELPKDLLKDPMEMQQQMMDMQTDGKAKLDKNSDLHPSRQKSSQDFASGEGVTVQKKEQTKLKNGKAK